MNRMAKNIKYSYDGKAGFVTGAASGIGAATAKAFAEAGAKVVIADIPSSKEQAEKIIAEIESNGGIASFYATDVTNLENVQSLIEYTDKTYGSIDFTFNNAGILATGIVADLDDTKFSKVMEVNVLGVWYCMKYTIQYMLKHGGGAIVNAASLASFVGAPGASAYCASKHAVAALTKAAAAENANLGIRINATAPAAIETPMVTSLPREGQAALMNPQAMFRFGKPEEVANLVLFLCSEEAGFITGAVYPIDGGATANAQSYDPALNPGL